MKSSNLTLRGYFCKVNKYGRLKFRYVGYGGISDGNGSESIEEYQKLNRAAEHHLGERYVEYRREKLLGINKYGECCEVSMGEETDSKKHNKESIETTECTEGSKDIEKSPVHLPFDEKGFTVALPKWIKKIPADITSRVGLVCTIEVKVTTYNFVSKLERNAGDNIIGIQLVFAGVKK